MDIWPIDFNKTIEEINEWFDGWKAERFGSDSLNPERYYKVTPDEKGRYLYGVAEGESLNDEKEKCDKVLELLLRIKKINDKLSGKALSQHLQWREREQLKEERETLYNTFLDEVQTEPEQTNEPQQTKPISKRKGRPKKCFKDYMINDPDGSKLQKIHALMDGQKGKGAALIILACIKIGWITRPTHKVVADEFGDIGVQQGFTRYLKDSMFTEDELEGAINSLK